MLATGHQFLVADLSDGLWLNILLEVKPPHEPWRPSVGWLVGLSVLIS